MTAAARLARSLRHRLGAALIDAGARLTRDAGPTLTPGQEQHMRRVLDAAVALVRDEEAWERMVTKINGGRNG